MATTIKDRILQLLEYEKIGQNKFEKKCGLSNGYLSNLKNTPGADKLQKIFDTYPYVSREWLLTGAGEMIIDNSTPAYTVPLVPITAAGGMLPGDADGVRYADCLQVLSPEPTAELAIDVTGESMAPAYPPGCRVFIRRVIDPAAIRYGDVYVIDTDEGAVIKTIMPADDPAFITAASINSRDYPPYKIPLNTIRSLWRVICRLIYQ